MIFGQHLNVVYTDTINMKDLNVCVCLCLKLINSKTTVPILKTQTKAIFIKSCVHPSEAGAGRSSVK